MNRSFPKSRRLQATARLAGPTRISTVLVATLFALLSAGAIGCDHEEKSDRLPTSYGSNEDDPTSVNGYSVLQQMFAKAGHKVSERFELSKALGESADTIVFAPDNFAPPDRKTINWFEKWLQEKPGRTLIYIGRDFDAEPLYWQKGIAKAPADEKKEYHARLEQATARVQLEHSTQPGGRCDWFIIDSHTRHRDVRELEGPWMDNGGAPTSIDATRVEIELNNRLIPIDSREIDELLTAGDDTIVSKRTFASRGVRRDFGLQTESQLLLVANGSFLMNLPLVNREHRKLAGKLIDEVGPAGRVVFLASDPSPSIRGSGSTEKNRTMFDVFAVWPLSVILLQFAALLALFGFSRWPLFGPPRDPPPAPASDFGQHVDAVADILAATGDARYARERWQYYQDNVRGKDGRMVGRE